MAISKMTEIGRITIADPVFVEALKEITEEEDLRGKIFLATKRGKIVTETAGLSENDVAQILRTEQEESGRYTLTFCVVVKFGESMHGLARALADRIALRSLQESGSRPAKVTVQIAGVQSKALMRRNLEIEIEYEDQ